MTLVDVLIIGAVAIGGALFLTAFYALVIALVDPDEWGQSSERPFDWERD